MKQPGKEIKVGGQVAKTKVLVSASLTGSRTGGEFRADLQKKGIDLVLCHGNGSRLFGATSIDHNSRTVLNGSALDKEFSANALAARFANFSQGKNHLEDLQPVSFISVKETLHPSVQYEPENKKYAMVKAYSRDDSPVGSLLSVLMLDPEQRDDNQQMPKKKKKKKRRYGRQM